MNKHKPWFVLEPMRHQQKSDMLGSGAQGNLQILETALMDVYKKHVLYCSIGSNGWFFALWKILEIPLNTFIFYVLILKKKIL